MIGNRLKDPRALMRMGWACLLLANLSRLFFHPTADFGRGFVDGVTGALFGASFCLLLSGVRRTRHPCARGRA